MNTTKPAALLALAVLLTVIAIEAYAGVNDEPEQYFVLKEGDYSPGEKLEINNSNGSTTSELNMSAGSNWEMALGQYSDPELAIELGIGYFESKGSAADPVSARLKAVPIFITVKEFMSKQVLQPYIAAGIGAYLTELNVSSNTGSFSSDSKTTYGFHGGVGLNIDIAKRMFIGLEGRYVWVKANYGGQQLTLNGFMRTINLGFSY